MKGDTAAPETPVRSRAALPLPLRGGMKGTTEADPPLFGSAKELDAFWTGRQVGGAAAVSPEVALAPVVFPSVVVGTLSFSDSSPLS